MPTDPVSTLYPNDIPSVGEVVLEFLDRIDITSEHEQRLAENFAKNLIPRALTGVTNPYARLKVATDAVNEYNTLKR